MASLAERLLSLIANHTGSRNPEYLKTLPKGKSGGAFLEGSVMDNRTPEEKLSDALFYHQSPEGVKELKDLALQFATFGGEKAKTADLLKLERAKALETAGKTAEDIWHETGWFKAPWDQKWRFEIPDTELKIDPARATETSPWDVPEFPERPLFENIEHKKLQEAYPEISEYTHGGQVFKETPEEFYDATLYPDAKHIEISGPPSQLPRTTAHELQHAIQIIEDFEKDGSARQTLNYQQNKENFDFYRRLAGEVEARLAATRQSSSPEQLKAFPLSQIDTPLEKIISRRKLFLSQ